MKNLKTAILLFLTLTLLTGIIYPLFIIAVARITFPWQAQGSFVTGSQGKIIGSLLIAQKFQNPKYFWPRPSAVDYNPLPSGGSNLAVGSKALQQNVSARKQAFLQQNPAVKIVPPDLLFASGSGLDPEISLAAASAQVDRVIKARHWAAAKKSTLAELLNKIAERRAWLNLGEPRINVLKLNLALDRI